MPDQANMSGLRADNLTEFQRQRAEQKRLAVERGDS
jgi:hypothetical protein